MIWLKALPVWIIGALGLGLVGAAFTWPTLIGIEAVWALLIVVAVRLEKWSERRRARR
jgi:hypothetical protein